MNDEPKELKDQYLSATLLYFLPGSFTGSRIGTSPRGNPEMWFTFRSKDECDQVIKEYETDTLLVNPREFCSCLARIREMYKSM